MKKLITILLVALVLIIPTMVKAETATSAGTRNAVKQVEKIDNKEKKLITAKELNDKKVASLEAKKNQALEKVRTSTVTRWEVFNRTINRAGELLDKLQAKIVTAKNAGKNTASMESWMSDARLKLTDASTILSQIKDKKGTAMTRVEFQDIQSKFKTMQKDLNIIRLDSSKIISSLKAFNSATNSAEKKATTSASER